MDEEDYDLSGLLKAYKTSTEKKFELDCLLNFIKKSQSQRNVVERFLLQLKENVSLLSPELFESNIVNLILMEIKWSMFYSRDKQILNLLFELFVDLNNAYTSYIYKSLSMIVKNLFSTCDDPTAESVDCQAVYALAHNLIESLFKIAPTCQVQIVKIVEQSFPYMIKETQVQRAFLSNVLRLANSYSNLRLALLEICIQKLLKIDVNLSREAILEEYESPDEDEEQMNSSIFFFFDVILFKLNIIFYRIN